MADPKYQLYLSAFVDGGLPEIIDTAEVFAFANELFGDVWRLKNRLEIHPIKLKLDPLFDQIRYLFERAEPAEDFVFKGLLERREEHTLGCSNMVIYDCNHIIK